MGNCPETGWRGAVEEVGAFFSGQRYLKAGRQARAAAFKMGNCPETGWRGAVEEERETAGQCFTMIGILRYCTKFVSESADSDTLFKEVWVEEGVKKGVCNWWQSHYQWDGVKFESIEPRFSSSLYNIMCAYRDAWGTAPGSELLRALECFEEQTEVWHEDLEVGD